jgi:DNA-binding FadR family transcriptional regulator
MLSSVVEDMGRRVAREESTRVQDRYFHRLLYEPVANPLLERLLDVFWEVAWRVRSPGAASAST